MSSGFAFRTFIRLSCRSPAVDELSNGVRLWFFSYFFAAALSFSFRSGFPLRTSLHFCISLSIHLSRTASSFLKLHERNA